MIAREDSTRKREESATNTAQHLDASCGYLRVRGARVHNLKNINVDIPRGQLVLVTGPSGCGKSSLVFDTILAEGRRQYIESLSFQSRRFLEAFERADVDSIEGLEPTISVDQEPQGRNPRSTVATVTEIHDYLRLLYARIGEARCPRCDVPVRPHSPQQIIDCIAALPEGTKVMLLAPLVESHHGSAQDVLGRIRKAGLVRARVDGAIYELDEIPNPQAREIEAVVDRLIIRQRGENRLADSIRLSLQFGEGLVRLLHQTDGKWQERLFSTRGTCPTCGGGLPQLEPQSFSFNTPYGACPSCDGLGLVEGSVCQECRGARLSPVARSCRVAGRRLHEVTALSVTDALRFFETVEVGSVQQEIALPIIQRIHARLEFLRRVGVEYLALERSVESLSGGELQRVRLASALGSGLVGVLYLLDEPSIGLHPRDADRLIDVLSDLRDAGNSVVVVEHDEAFMRRSDYLLELGPGAGPNGGHIVAAGTWKQVAANADSITGAYLAGRKGAASASRGAGPAGDRSLRLEGATGHNLRDVSVDIPLERLVCVTGVSGSGKSTLAIDTLAAALARDLNRAQVDPLPYRRLSGTQHLARVVQIDQSPIGRTPRSNPATYTGAFDAIRNVFAATKLARLRGFSARRFSFNAKEGRCAECQGYGVKRIEMQMLANHYVRCATCRGAQFNAQTLEVKFKGRSIANILQMNVDEAVAFFENQPSIHRTLEYLQKVGLGYLQLGQPSTTLSGGEAQRIKLGAELGRRATAGTFYVLDEPTTGLSREDVGRLQLILRQLVDEGGTVLVIEHHLDVVRQADWVIDLGPEGGADGGTVVAAGPPEEIAKAAGSITGRFL